MENSFDYLRDLFDRFIKERDQFEQEEMLRKAQAILGNIRRSGDHIYDTEERNILSSQANELGDLIFDLSGEYPAVRLALPPYIYISYRHDVERDKSVALQIAQALGHKHEIFFDQSGYRGASWAERIEVELRRTDYLITLLSARSVRSEMTLAEIEMARHLGWEKDNKPVILPVLLAYREPFPYPLNEYLQPLNWSWWRFEEDTPRIINELKQAISGGALPVDDRLKPHIIRNHRSGPPSAPSPVAQPVYMEEPEGTMNPDSTFYVERQEDHIALDAIKRQGVTITIKGPRQMGKSSLLMRIIKASLEAGKRVAYLDFQLLDDPTLADAETFYRRFCSLLSKELDVPDRVAACWKQPLGNNQRCTSYVGEYLLKKVKHPVVLAIDEVDSIFNSPFRADYFSMLRNWHNQRQNPTAAIWGQLDLALVTSTEPYLLIDNIRSPFNVGHVLELSDFTMEQMADLNRRHNSPLTRTQLGQLRSLLAGHPFLTRRALYLVASERLSANDLFGQAADMYGPFGDHLRYHLHQLLRQGQPELIAGMRQVLQNNTCSDEDIFFRLHGAGLVRRPLDGRPPAAYPRCQLYADFFQEHLHG